LPSKPFESLEDARAWLQIFAGTTLNIGIVPYVSITPEQRHTGVDKELLQKRNKVYQLAKKQNPKRWSGNTRNWEKKVCFGLILKSIVPQI